LNGGAVDENRNAQNQIDPETVAEHEFVTHMVVTTVSAMSFMFTVVTAAFVVTTTVVVTAAFVVAMVAVISVFLMLSVFHRLCMILM
jgi:GTP cyclohydrolase III